MQVGDMGDHGPAYDRFVAELALRPDMIDRLLSWHPAVGDCDACRLPGAQVAIAAPCSIRLVAERARTLAAGHAEAG
jgi:hypothetical protein